MHTSLNLRKNPTALLLFTTVIMLIAIALRRIVDVDFENKVMFGMPMGYLVWSIPLFLIFLWLAYQATRKFLYSVTAIWLHVIATVMSTVLVVLMIYLAANPTHYIIERHLVIGKLIQAFTLVFGVAQLVYLVNVGFGLLKRHKH